MHPRGALYSKVRLVCREQLLRCGRAHTFPWHCLNFLPEPQGQGALRGTLPNCDSGARGGAATGAAPMAERAAPLGRAIAITGLPEGLAGSGSALTPAKAGSCRVSRIGVVTC